ncbi:hypothetical protein JCM10295v2_005270 [Rhodotorula toruloides]
MYTHGCPLCLLDKAVIDPATWADVRPSVLSLVLANERRDKLRLLDRNGYRIGNCAYFVLNREPSPFVDSGPSKGLAPYHSALSDDDINPIFDRLVSLFRCGVCSARRGPGELETSVGDETWAHCRSVLTLFDVHFDVELSGKSPVNLELSRRKLSHSTDRNVVQIKLSKAGGFVPREIEA